MTVHPQKGWSGDRLFPRLDLFGKALGGTWKLYDIEERLENLRAEPPFQPFSLGLYAPLPGWRQPCQTTKETPLLKCQLDLHHKCMWEFNFHLTFQPLVNHLGSHYFFNIQSVFHEKILDLIIHEWTYMYNKDQLPIWYFGTHQQFENPIWYKTSSLGQFYLWLTASDCSVRPKMNWSLGGHVEWLWACKCVAIWLKASICSRFAGKLFSLSSFDTICRRSGSLRR